MESDAILEQLTKHENPVVRAIAMVSLRVSKLEKEVEELRLRLDTVGAQAAKGHQAWSMQQPLG